MSRSAGRRRSITAYSGPSCSACCAPMPSHPERFRPELPAALIIQLDNNGTRAQSAGMRRLLGSSFLTPPTHLLAAAIAAGALLGQSGRADAFVEDLCYAK